MDHEKCVHTEHCCLKHGCKYSDSDCPVEDGTKPQSFDCEECGWDIQELPTLDEWNKRYSLIPKTTKNGIRCPKCNMAELHDSDDMILTSNPPQRNIHCESCDYKGYRRT